jgi:hypothetical protein
MHLRKHIHKS